MCRQEEENARKKDEYEIDEAYIAGLIGKIDEHEAAEKIKNDAFAEIKQEEEAKDKGQEENKGSDAEGGEEGEDDKDGKISEEENEKDDQQKQAAIIRKLTMKKK